MKKSVKMIAAALAAITAMSCVNVTAFADKLKTVDGIKYRYSDSGEQIGTFSGWSTGKSGAKYYYKNGVRVKNTWINDKKGRYRYIDKTGKIVIPCKWNSVEVNTYDKMMRPQTFVNGKARVRNDSGKLCYIDKTGAIVK